MSKWRTGSKVPINIYHGDKPVAQCQSPEYAAQIVAAVNRITELEAERDAAEDALAALRKALEDAPHDRLRCSSLIEPVPGATTACYRCNCWKAQIPQPTP